MRPSRVLPGWMCYPVSQNVLFSLRLAGVGYSAVRLLRPPSWYLPIWKSERTPKRWNDVRGIIRIGGVSDATIFPKSIGYDKTNEHALWSGVYASASKNRLQNTNTLSYTYMTSGQARPGQAGRHSQPRFTVRGAKYTHSGYERYNKNHSHAIAVCYFALVHSLFYDSSEMSEGRDSVATNGF